MTTVNTASPEAQGPPPPPPEASSLNKELKDIIEGGKSKEAVESSGETKIAELTQEIADLKAENKALKAGVDIDVVAKADDITNATGEDVVSAAEALTKEAAKDPRGIEDLVDIDKNGRGHEPKQLNVSGKRSGGQFISKDNMDVISANASFIRDNLPPQPSVDTTTPEGGASNNSPEEPGSTVHTPEELPPVDPGPTTPRTPSEPGPSETPVTPPSEPAPVDPGPVNPPEPGEPGPGYRPATPDDEDLPGGMGQEPYRIDDETPTPPGPQEVLDIPQGGEPGDPAEIAFEMSTRDLDFSIEAFAVARVSREKMLSGGAEETQLRLQQQELHDRFEQWSEALAEVSAKREIELDQWSATADQYIAQSSDKLADLIAMRSLPADQIPPMLEAEIKEQQDYIASMNDYQASVANEKVALHERFERDKAEKLIDVRTRVDATMLAEREKNHPRLAKISNWLKKHPKARLIASASMIGLGVIGTLTANPPLIGIAVAGKTALRGIGGYNAVRAGGEWKVNRDLAKHGEDTSIEDYTGSAIKGSTTRRRSKRGGAVAGAALAAAPFVAHALFDNTPDGPPKVGPTVDDPPEPPKHGDPGWTPLPPDPPVPPTEIPFTGTDNSYPWTHFKGLVGAGEATPKILQLADKATSMGWKVIGEGGGGTGKILSMTSPGGTVYTGNAAINAALDGINATP